VGDLISLIAQRSLLNSYLLDEVLTPFLHLWPIQISFPESNAVRAQESFWSGL